MVPRPGSPCPVAVSNTLLISHIICCCKQTTTWPTVPQCRWARRVVSVRLAGTSPEIRQSRSTGLSPPPGADCMSCPCHWSRRRHSRPQMRNYEPFRNSSKAPMHPSISRRTVDSAGQSTTRHRGEWWLDTINKTKRPSFTVYCINSPRWPITRSTLQQYLTELCPMRISRW